MIFILFFVAWVALASLVDPHLGAFRNHSMPTLPRHQVVAGFWIAIAAVILTTNETLLFDKLLSLLPVAATHVHLSARQAQQVTWQALLRCMVDRLQHAIRQLHNTGGTRP